MPQSDAVDDLSPSQPREGADRLRRRLLDTAQSLVEQANGLAVSLDSLSYDRVIKEAGVARTSAYRIWPNKDAFYVDLLCDLAGPAWQGTAAFDEKTIMLTRSILAERLDELPTPEGRLALIKDLMRLGAKRNFEALITSNQWRTYIALTATVITLPNPEDRDRVQRALQSSEKNFLRHMAEFYGDLAVVLGYRLRSHIPSWEVMAAIGASVVEGVGLRRMLSPGIVDEPIMMDNQEWHLAALVYWSAVDAAIELDPDYKYASAITTYLKRLAERESRSAG